ncbi:MAG: penicillin-binding protein activator LpoB [Treponema sp.]|jgi:uncharacterized protein (TIGR02722 family)|nr:penicillin-binding protein activator LpoB [Treponema sp.]
MKKMALLLLVIFLLLAGCGTAKVTRVDINTLTDLSGYWNDQDVRIVCESLINDCLSSPRVDQAIKAMKNKTPAVIVGTFRNESSEHIDTSIITSIMETTIFNTGKMDFIASGAKREALRAERQDQLVNASEETAASLANETGADFMLLGSVKTIVDKAGNKTVRTYFINAELTNIETNQRIWMGQNTEIKKLITRPKVKL